MFIRHCVSWISDEIVEVSDTDEQPPQGSPILISDDDDDDDDDRNDLEGPVLIEDDSCDEDQTPSNEKKRDEFVISQNKSSHDVGKQDLGENVCQPPNDDPKAELEISKGKLSSDEEPVLVVAQPRKRKNKTKNIPVTPVAGWYQFSGYKRTTPFSVVKREKEHGTSKKNPSAAKFEQCEPGYLPEKIDIGWSKKMLRTAGLCTTGETRHPKRERYAKIQISQKVCDSADRLRDTLIHEICHAASWLLDGIRDSHGVGWKYYAQKSNMVHPELPKVTRCHNYKINYRIHYECTKCKFRVGRYTRSLDTDRFICAKCKGPLVILPLTRKDGTPIEPHVRPFAKYVQENYRIVRKGMAGIGHGDVMRKLSKDYNAKKQSQGH
ncbi:hypothetical protein J1605_003673 [Eschrichtius robustus]|uniref:SprT-like domain-containing protein n=1 Tax=Eschrichtius robustus TaxID=9764 RepID=A0AB34HPL0_ESCRO|nr:hypothetical protein J1605_003673 [Eschrichtius robustus]